MYSDLLVAATFAAALGEAAGFDGALGRLRARRDALAAERARPELSEVGEVVVDFLQGLAELHIRALESLRGVEAGGVVEEP